MPHFRLRAALLAALVLAPLQALLAADDKAYLDALAEFKGGAAEAAIAKRDGSAILLALKLRQLFQNTSMYAPYADPADEKIREAREHAAAGRFEACLAAAEAAVELNFTNLTAQRTAGTCAQKLDPKNEQKIRQFLVPYALLIGSIIGEPGRDGTGPDTSFHVNSISEEYEALEHLGLKSGGQSLVPGASGRPNDCHRLEGGKFKGSDRICFDVDVPMAKLDKALQPPP